VPNPDFILVPEVPTLSVALEPAYNILHSFLLINSSKHLQGLGEWVTQTKAALTPEQIYNNELVLYGLYFACEPDRSWPTFEAYLDHLGTQDPVLLRDRVFNAYISVILNEDGHTVPVTETSSTPYEIQPLLDNVDLFLTFLGERFPQKSINVKTETEAHKYLNDPPALQTLISTHLRDMWENYGASEWERVKPILQASVDAFQQIDFTSFSNSEAVEMIIDKPVEDCQCQDYDKYERIVFIPSAHVGPYHGMFKTDNTLYFLFGARIPEGVGIDMPDLSRAEILVRVTALADDTRLRILRLVHDEGELRSREIMEKLDLSQSAASRHLKQLSATGYLNERRCAGSKCYALNTKQVENTLKAISAFLLGGEENF